MAEHRSRSGAGNAILSKEVLHTEEIIGLLDELLSAMPVEDFLVALPALRQAFAFFPPRERETIAERLLTRRGIAGSGRSALRGVADAAVVAAGMHLDEQIDTLLRREGLLP